MSKILFYTDTSYFSGAEIYFSHAISAVTSLKCDLEVMVSPSFSDVSHPAWLDIKGDQNITIRYLATGNKLDPVYALKLYQFLKRSKPDLIICNMWTPYSNTWLLLTAKLLAIPVVAVEHFYQQRSEITGALRPIKLFAYWLSNKITPYFIAVSQAHKDIFVNEFSFPASKIAVIHPGVDVNLVKKHPPSKEVILAYSGTLEPRKNPLFLIKVLSSLTDIPWRLEMLGKGPQEKELREAIANHDLTSRITLHGWVDKPDAVVGKADIFLHPALSENFSFVLVEAAGLGLPTIANDVGGNKEIVLNKKTGIIESSSALDNWTNDLRDLILNKELRKEMSIAALSYYQEELTLKKMKDRFLTYITTILNDKR